MVYTFHRKTKHAIKRPSQFALKAYQRRFRTIWRVGRRILKQK
jgi:hypothetical protein